MFLVESTQ